ncbi:MAG: winged helix-turn-helix domain-containing protein, partial [Kiloniellales bacterium]|nr:winged helix-turn-helix domain-containing protein [Kiloniellales bacterium]
MDVEPSIAIIGHLIGVPARANILSALMDGRALTATELSYRAGVSPQTTSSHLAKLVDAELLAAFQQGRHRYYKLAGPQIAEALEPLTAIVAHKPVPKRGQPSTPEDLRPARLCYDHLAGRLGVALADALQAGDYLVPDKRDFVVSEAGETFFLELGIDMAALRKQRRLFARQCIDWSERRPHLGGALGAALAARFLKRRWISRQPQG